VFGSVVGSRSSLPASRPGHDTVAQGPAVLPVALLRHRSHQLRQTQAGLRQSTDQHPAVRVSVSMYQGWRRGVVVSGVRRKNEVSARRARLLPGWVTVFGRVYHLGM